MTRHDLERMAKELAALRYDLWRKCGTHNWPVLPTTQDTGEHYCITCLTLFSRTGKPLNEPQRSERSGVST